MLFVAAALWCVLVEIAEQDTDGWRNMKSPAMWSVPFFVYPAEACPKAVREVADFTALWYNLSNL